MSVKTEATKLIAAYKEIVVQTISVKGAVAQTLSSLPENPNSTRIGTQGNCFTIKSSGLRIESFDPFHYDFKAQYCRIQSYMEAVIDSPTPAKITQLSSLLEKRRESLKGRTFVYHPEVISQIKSIVLDFLAIMAQIPGSDSPRREGV